MRSHFVQLFALASLLVACDPSGKDSGSDTGSDLVGGEAFLDAGNPALIGISALHRGTEWNRVLGVEGADQWDSREVDPASGAATNLFDGAQTFPEGMRGVSSSRAIDGHALTAPDGSGVPLASYDSADGSDVAIMSMRGGQLIVNGLFGDVFKRVDNDEDALPDAMELYVNEILLVTGCTPAQ